jgi:hypothetical protein
MTALGFEWRKITHKRFSLILLLCTVVLFPILIKTIAYWSATKDNVPEGLYAQHVAFAVIAYTQTYLFLPVWIIVFPGLEFLNRHVNRVVFIRSRKYYLHAKLLYCLVITLLFSALGFITLLITLNTSPYPTLNVDAMFYCRFFIQSVLSIFSFSILLLFLVFVFRNPIIAFVVYFAWTFIEGILFTVLQGVYNVEAKWLPLHLVRTMVTRNGELTSNEYYMPLDQGLMVTIYPIAFVVFLISVTYYSFLKSDLPVLSD